MTKENTWWETVTFDFIKIPKDLFRMPQYCGVSPMAKLLYGFLMDRTSLSAANGERWMDECGECFVYFPITEIMDRFQCGHDKAATLLRELEQAGLITRTLKNRGKPYRIVIRPFETSSKSSNPADRGNRAADLGNSEGNKTEKNKTDLNKTNPITPADREGVMKEIKENLCYDVLLEQVPQNLLDGILDVIVDTICTTAPTVRIAGESVPREEVYRRFRALDQMDIYYVNDLLKREPGEIRYLRSFILARLYEAKNLSDTYYTRWVDRDMKKEPA